MFFLWDELERGEHSERFVLQYNDDRVTDVSVGKDFTRIRFFSAKKTVPTIFPADDAVLLGPRVTATPSTAAWIHVQNVGLIHHDNLQEETLACCIR